MSTFKITVSGSPRLPVPGLSPAQMQGVGTTMITVMRDRLLHGHNLQDLPSRPLSARYAKYKQRIGADPIRNLRLTGHTLADLAVLEQEDNRVTVGFQSRDALLRALFNQSYDPMVGLSKHDQDLVRADVHDQILNSLHNAL